MAWGRMWSLLGNILVLSSVQIGLIVTSGSGGGMSDIHVQIAEQFVARRNISVISIVVCVGRYVVGDRVGDIHMHENQS